MFVPRSEVPRSHRAVLPAEKTYTASLFGGYSAVYKRCTCCRVDKNINDFYLKGKNKPEPRSVCIPCWDSKSYLRTKKY